MLTTIHFTKMHGLGNDFVVIDNITQHIKLTPGLVRKIANRNFGIGCDQVLIVDPPFNAEFDFSYRIFNNDGKEVTQCGNGARCFGRYVFDKGLAAKKILNVETSINSIQIDITDLTSIKVNMGKPIFSPADIPLHTKAIQPLPNQGRYKIAISSVEREVTILSLSNPHCIIFVPNVNEINVEEMGKALQKHPAFPKSVNVTFVQVLARNHIKCRVYERGAGETLACGSAACATVIAGVLQNELNREVKVDMPGGALTVNWLENDEVLLSGPTVCVFQGKFCLNTQEP